MPVLTLNSKRFLETPLPLGTSWLLASCMEAKGKQDLWTRQKPEVLAVLRERAIVQSVESSNRIEGVTVEALRFRPLVLGKSRPRDRSEEELSGYRRALDWIFSRKGRLKITSSVIRKLHAFAQGGASSPGGVFGGADAGEWKKRNNEIIELPPGGGDRRIRFVPASAKETPRLIEELCKRYVAACEDQRVPALLLVSAFVFDFLCIHPFRDGNGRVSRLITTLLLQSHGFEVSRYVSLERLVEASKEDYYRVLEDTSKGWHDGSNDVVPWWNYVLGVVRSAYQELETQVEFVAGRPVKGDLVRRTVLEQVGDFTLGDVVAQAAGVSPQLVKKVLSELRGEGKIALTGRGRGARWRIHVKEQATRRPRKLP